jgi:hypothetical protein
LRGYYLDKNGNKIERIIFYNNINESYSSDVFNDYQETIRHNIHKDIKEINKHYQRWNRKLIQPKK